jgi:hypothetical protein
MYREGLHPGSPVDDATHNRQVPDVIRLSMCGPQTEQIFSGMRKRGRVVPRKAFGRLDRLHQPQHGAIDGAEAGIDERR